MVGVHHIKVGATRYGALPIAILTATDGAYIEVVGCVVIKTGQRYGSRRGKIGVGNNRIGIHAGGAVNHFPRRGQRVSPGKTHLSGSCAGGMEVLRDGAAADLTDGDVVEVGVAIIATQTAVDNIAGVGGG